MVAANSKDIAFIVLMAGVGIPGDELLLMQQKLIGKTSGISDQDLQKSEEANKKIFEIVKKSTSVEELKTAITSFIKQELKEHPDESMNDDVVNGQVNYIATPWMRYFISYNPALALQKTTCPVLALNGEKDLQVPAKENLEAIKNALNKGGNKKVTTKQFPNLNHLFQECKTGSPEEYATIEQTISPDVLKEIADWIMSYKS